MFRDCTAGPLIGLLKGETMVAREIVSQSGREPARPRVLIARVFGGAELVRYGSGVGSVDLVAIRVTDQVGHGRG